VERQDLSDTEDLRRVIEHVTAEQEPWVHDGAAMTLAALGPRAPRDALVALLRSPFHQVRHVGARALADRPGDAPFALLLNLLDDPEDYVRWQAGVAVAAQRQRVPPSALFDRLARGNSSMNVGLLLALGAFSPHPPAQIMELVRNALAHADATFRAADHEMDEEIAGELAGESGTNDDDADNDPWIYGIDHPAELFTDRNAHQPLESEVPPKDEHGDASGAGAARSEFGAIDATDLMRAAVRVTSGWAEDVLASAGVEGYLRGIAESHVDPEDAGPIAAATLARLDASRPLEHWIAQLHDASWSVRARAARMLGEFLDAWGEVLLGEAQHDAVGQVRLAATEALGKTLARVKAQKGLPIVLEFLQAEDSWVRCGALHGLVHFKDAAPIEAIQGALYAVDEVVQDAAFDALLELRTPIPEDAILRRLERVPEWMRSELVSDLGKLGVHAPVELLVRILQNQEPAIHGERMLAVSYDRVAAAGALGDLGEAAPLEPLLAALQDDEFWVRGAAMQALGRLGRNAPVELITAGLGCGHFYVEECAVLACKYLGAAVPITRLQQAVGDPMFTIREAAQRTLAEIAPWALEEVLPEALAILGGCLQDTSLGRCYRSMWLGSLAELIPRLLRCSRC
jgi:HEAT repeat protein